MLKAKGSCARPSAPVGVGVEDLPPKGEREAEPRVDHRGEQSGGDRDADERVLRARAHADHRREARGYGDQRT